MRELIEYMLLSSLSLFVIIDPIAMAPGFLAMTPRETPEERTRMARLACMVAAGVLIFFVIFGESLFRLLGITLPAFKIAGSIVLLLIALDMLRAQHSTVQVTPEETAAGEAKDDIAITPLGIPMLAGPGAMTTVVLLRSQAGDMMHFAALIVSILGVCLLSFYIFRIAAHGAERILSPIAMKIVIRLMGLLLAALAIQFAIDGIAESRIFEKPITSQSQAQPASLLPSHSPGQPISSATSSPPTGLSQPLSLPGNGGPDRIEPKPSQPQPAPSATEPSSPPPR